MTTLETNIRKRVPVCDFDGNFFYDGDRVKDLHGNCGTVQYDITAPEEWCWTVNFGTGSLMPLHYSNIANYRLVVEA